MITGDISSYKNSNRLISFFGRLTYNYNSKYYITGTIRRDGSSKFGKNKEWGLFPSGSIAWNIKEEEFLKNSDFIEYKPILIDNSLIIGKEIEITFGNEKTIAKALDIDEFGNLIIDFNGQISALNAGEVHIKI